MVLQDIGKYVSRLQDTIYYIPTYTHTHLIGNLFNLGSFTKALSNNDSRDVTGNRYIYVICDGKKEYACLYLY